MGALPSKLPVGVNFPAYEGDTLPAEVEAWADRVAGVEAIGDVVARSLADEAIVSLEEINTHHGEPTNWI